MGAGAIVEFLIVEEDVRYGFLLPANLHQHLILERYSICIDAKGVSQGNRFTHETKYS